LENAKLVAVAAVRPGPLHAQAQGLGVKGYTSLDELMADRDVDAVIIATPHPSHCEITLKAASAGKHVFTEKPMSVTLAEADAMIEAARSAGVLLGVLYQNRFRPEYQKARSIIEDGLLGDIYRTHMVHATIRSQNYYESASWRGTWAGEGGGVLLNQGIHSIDILQWLAGMPRSVCGTVASLKHGIEVEDFASALLKYDNGGQGSVHCNTVQSPNEVVVKLWGEQGSMAVSDRRVTLDLLEQPISDFMRTGGPGTSAHVPHKTQVFDFEPLKNAHAPAIGDFAGAVLKGRDPAVTGEEGLKPQELAAAILLSGCLGGKVSLPVNRTMYDGLLGDLRRRGELPP